MNPLEEYYQQLDEPHRSCLLAIRQIILRADSQITESFTWNMPLFKYRKKILCYLRQHKQSKRFYLGLSEGKHLHHQALKAEGRKQYKAYYFDTDADIDQTLINQWIKQSMGFIDERLA